MSLTQTEKMGLAKNFLELLAVIALELDGTALDPARIKEDVTKKYDRAARANANQEEAKRVSMEATAEVNEATDDLYRAVSGYLDAIVGVVGKGSTGARNMVRLRSRIRAPGDQATEATTVEPVTESGK